MRISVHWTISEDTAFEQLHMINLLMIVVLCEIVQVTQQHSLYYSSVM